MLSDLHTLLLVGLFLGWLFTRGATIDVSLRKTAAMGVLGTGIVMLISLAANWQTGGMLAALACGICCVVLYKCRRLSRRLPRSWLSRPHRSAQPTVLGDEDGNLCLEYPDGMMVAYGATGSVVRIVFPDGTVWDCREEHFSSV